MYLKPELKAASANSRMGIARSLGRRLLAIGICILFHSFNFRVVSGKLSTTEILNACECQSNVPICDFYDFSKKKLKSLIKRLQLSSVECDGEGVPLIDGEYANNVGNEEEKGIEQTLSVEQKIGVGLGVQMTPSGQVSAPAGQYLPMRDVWLQSVPDTSSITEPVSSSDCVLNNKTGCGAPQHGLFFHFPTFLLKHYLLTDAKSRKHNKQIADVMLELESQDEGCKFNLHGGYRSQDAFLSRKEPGIRWLNAQIDQRVKMLFEMANASELEYTIDGWGAVLRRGHGQPLHVHPASLFAGVYYAAVPEGVGSHGNAGCLRLVDPRIGVAMVQDTPNGHVSPSFVSSSTAVASSSEFGGSIDSGATNVYGSTNSYHVCAEPGGGTLLLFPSWLMHEVQPMLPSFKGPRIGISFNVDLKGRWGK